MSGDNTVIREGYPNPDCSAAWTKHRKQTRIVWGLFAGWIPYGFSVITLLNWLHCSFDAAFGIAIVPYALVLLVLSMVGRIFGAQDVATASMLGDLGVLATTDLQESAATAVYLSGNAMKSTNTPRLVDPYAR